MKTEKNILAAFVLNLAFSVFELIGGIFTGSVAILSDAVHDVGDAISIGSSYFLEKKSKKRPDDVYTYGYVRYSVLGGLITTLILLLGSVVVVTNAVGRLITPVEINYNGMIVFALIGVCVNLLAAFFTHCGGSLNQRAVNLHMLEDVLGWIVVLIGAVVMRFTDLAFIDPLLSIGVAVFILANAIKNLKEVFELLLEKVPHGIEISKIKERLSKIDGVLEVHHLHVWSLDGQRSYATMHVVTNGDFCKIKGMVRKELEEHGVAHVTLELESPEESCAEKSCRVNFSEHPNGCHHHHHHHHH